MSRKQVYFFGNAKAEGSAEDKTLLGGKGANLAEMTNLGIPVPPGFTITTEVCAQYYRNNHNFPESLQDEILQHLRELERVQGKHFGDVNDPLLVSVRSGAAVSMPGMMDTVLNLGLNDETVVGLAKKSGNERFAWDAYRRFINMFGNVVLGISHHHFEKEIGRIKKEKKASLDSELDITSVKMVVEAYKQVVLAHHGEGFPQDVYHQLWASVQAVFRSWNNDRAIRYRRINSIIGLEGTAVNVQSMVFGNYGLRSGTGVCFSRDASTGEKVFYGEYLQNAQGEDVVAGIRTPQPLSFLQKDRPHIYEELVTIKDRLEAHYRDMQDIEFTMEEEKLYILQTRNAKRTGIAAVKIAVDMVQENLIDKKAAIIRVSGEQLQQLFHPMIDPEARKKSIVLAKGLNASPGAASGKMVFSAEEAEKSVENGNKVILVRNETSPEDIGGMNVAEGILTATGGMTSHAAVVARGMGRPCVVGCRDMHVYEQYMEIKGKKFQRGEIITIDGNMGEVFAGEVAFIEPSVSNELHTFLNWADEFRLNTKRKERTEFRVRTNADTPQQAQMAREMGAEGIGLCRTEHMFFEDTRIMKFRRMILANNKQDREQALSLLLPLQQSDFEGIFSAMDGLPVTIRLLDPPLHEFLPREDARIRELAEKTGMTELQLRVKIQELSEQNPMLGHRGCRLGITYPEIYQMQVRAIVRASIAVYKQGKRAIPEIMIPLIGAWQELRQTKELVESVIKEELPSDISIPYSIGTMIEIPRAALTAEKIAPYVDFFSFGTNDLTQMTFGFSRDDVNTFLPFYITEGILDEDPFQTLDVEGVGQLVEIGVRKGRSVNKKLKIGICGEHGGDIRSIAFCYEQNFDYVSCSPLRVPTARLAAAQQAVLDDANT